MQCVVGSPAVAVDRVCGVMAVASGFVVQLTRNSCYCFYMCLLILPMYCVCTCTSVTPNGAVKEHCVCVPATVPRWCVCECVCVRTRTCVRACIT